MISTMQKTKQITYTVVMALAVMLSLTSCNNFLDIKPYGKTIPKTTEEFSALINGLLDHLDDGNMSSNDVEGTFFNNSDAETFDAVSDNMAVNLTTYPLGNLLKNYYGDIVTGSSNLYGGCYTTISRCNMVFDNYEDGRDTQAGKDLLGTCYALRGVAYYQLLRMFCPPPGSTDDPLGVSLVTTFDMEAKPNRASRDETIAQAESDLKKALDYHIQDEMYRFNDDVIKGYLARLYFWAGRFDEAKAMADDVLTRHPLLSGEDYKKMMTSYTGLMGNELLRCERDPFTGFDQLNTYLQARPVSASLVNLFTEKSNDIRYSLFFNKKRQNKKFFFSGLRAAELYLISMESAYHMGNTATALEMLNEFRAHRISNVTPYTMASLPAVPSDNLIKEDCTGRPLTPLLNAILNERRKELYLEGDRFFELKRNGRPEFWVMKKGLKYTNYKFMYTFPIPAADIQVSPNLVQNPGYTEFTY